MLSRLTTCLLVLTLPPSHFTAQHKSERGGHLSPRMEYAKWTPLGRGDPLKNDPTYDYVPPVLDRVHYWLEPPRSTVSPAEVLVLGATKTTEPVFRHRVRTQYIPLHSSYYHVPYKGAVPAAQKTPATMLLPPLPPPDTPQTTPGHWDAGNTQLATLAVTSSPLWKVTEPRPSATTTVLPPATTDLHVVSPVIDIPSSSVPSSSLLHFLLQNELATTPAKTTFPKTTSAKITTTYKHSKPSICTSTSSTTTSTTTLPTPTNSPNPVLTTDPLFSHYKQPAEPFKGPMYLIIQGHSKVKTYGASKLDASGTPIQESNEVSSRRRSRQISVEDLIPLDDDTAEAIQDLIKEQEEGSGFGAIIAEVIQ